MRMHRRGPTNGVGDSLRAAAAAGWWLLVLVTVCLLQSTSEALPTKVQRHRTDDAETLSSILQDLESIVFRLKDYALRIDYESRKSSDSDFDTYPELVAETHDRKSSIDSVASATVINQTSSTSQQQPKPLSADASAADKPQGTTGQGSAGKPSITESQVDDISLREALEYLVSLAKQKKQEKRDHDIPFP